MALVQETMHWLLNTGTMLISPFLIGLWIFASPSVWAASSPSKPSPKVEGNSEEGRKIYNGKGFCYECHGYDGYIDRQPQMEPELRRLLGKLDPKPADFRNPATLQSKNDQRHEHVPQEISYGCRINSIVA